MQKIQRILLLLALAAAIGVAAPGYKVIKGSRITDYTDIIVPDSATEIARTADVTGVVTGELIRAASAAADYLWDDKTHICYRRQMNNGNLDYVAVTNINVLLPENRAALLALEASR